MPDKEIIPAIYIPCFARKDALHRLCISLHQSILLHCEQHPDHNGHIELVFSVDHQAAPEVISYVKEFVWAFGPKAFVLHTERLGPDGNNLFCLSEAMKKGAIILLEEDTFVTHGFYEFACKALAFYNDENDIAGISLYNYEWNDEANLPFLKPQNGYDVYCFEKVSSRGLAVSRNMVKSFLQWKDEKAKPDFKNSLLPEYMKRWGDEVWEKWFNLYLIQNGKTCIHPYHSLTTNFGERGAHVKKASEEHSFQSLLQLTHDGNFRFGLASLLRYDIHCEMMLQKALVVNGETLLPELDLYGCKRMYRKETQYVITSKKVSNFVRSYGRHLKPHELNVLFTMDGDDFFLARRSAVPETHSVSVREAYRNWYYFFRDVSLLQVIKLKIFEVLKRKF